MSRIIRDCDGEFWLVVYNENGYTKTKLSQEQIKELRDTNET